MKNSNNKMSPLNDEMNIYSKNDSNLQESGHVGKSKYDSNKYKNITKENINTNIIINKQLLFSINEELNGKYSKPNLNIKKTERAESRLSSNKIKKKEIRKIQSKISINSSNKNNNIKDTYINNRNKNKKIKTKSTYSLKANNININDNNKRSQKYIKEEINTNNINERKSYNFNRNDDPVLNRMKKMKDNYCYKEIFNNTFNRTINNNNNILVNSQIIQNENKPINNYCQFISINGFSNTNKIKKIPTGRYIEIQPKLKPYFEINNATKQISRNTRQYKENKENIPININNTIMNCSYKQSIYNNEIKPVNSINYRPSCNPHKMFNSKNRYIKKENVIKLSTENYLKLKSEMEQNSKINLMMINKNKNIGSYLCNKLNTINVNNKKNIRLAQIKRTNIPKNNISRKKLMVKSFVMKNGFEF